MLLVNTALTGQCYVHQRHCGTCHNWPLQQRCDLLPI